MLTIDSSGSEAGDVGIVAVVAAAELKVAERLVLLPPCRETASARSAVRIAAWHWPPTYPAPRWLAEPR